VIQSSGACGFGLHLASMAVIYCQLKHVLFGILVTPYQ